MLLNYQDRGSSDGPVLLLFHPMGADLTFWDACVDIWSDHHRCIAVDMPGSGLSPSAKQPLTPALLASAVEEFVSELALDQIVPIGCAVGAMTAATFAARNQAICMALILSNPGFQTQAPARIALLERAQKVRDHGMKSILPAVIDNALEGCVRTPKIDQFEELFSKQDPVSYALALEGILDVDLSEVFQMIDTNTLLVSGGRDALLPRHHADKIVEVMPGATHLHVDEGAHFLPFQMPQEFCRYVDSFLEEPMG